MAGEDVGGNNVVEANNRSNVHHALIMLIRTHMDIIIHIASIISITLHYNIPQTSSPAITSRHFMCILLVLYDHLHTLMRIGSKHLYSLTTTSVQRFRLVNLYLECQYLTMQISSC